MKHLNHKFDLKNNPPVPNRCSRYKLVKHKVGMKRQKIHKEAMMCTKSE